MSGLEGLLRQLLVASPEASRKDIADTAREQLGDLRNEAIDAGLRMMVGKVAGRMRREAIRDTENDCRRKRAERASTAEKQLEDALTSALQESERIHAKALLNVWKETPTGHKPLGRCTTNDVLYSATRYALRQAGAERAALGDRRLAAAMDKNGAATVSDLSYEQIAEAITGV